MPRAKTFGAAVCHGPAAALLLAGALLVAHGRDARYVQDIAWKKQHVARVFAASRSELGLSGSKRKLEMKMVGDTSCAVASLIALDVDDRYAFDVDEPVDVTITYAPDLTTAPFAVAWDKNGGDGFGVSADVKPEAGASLRSVTLRLDRARFANQGILGTDLAVGARNQGVIGLCDIDAARSNTTRPSAAFGRIRLEITDAQSARAVAARVGLYDVTGRTPLPSDDAVSVHRFAAEARLQWLNRRTFWPSGSRQAFYVNGTYEGRVPAGTFDLVVARGPEYRLDVVADARMNPDVDRLDRLELVILGDVQERQGAGDSDRIHLQTTLTAEHSMWIAVRAYGKHQEPQFTTVAHSAPIYVVVADQPAWRADAVPALVDYQRAQLNELLTVSIDPNSDLEAWETGDTLVDQWPKQLPLLRARIEEADRRYRQLLDRFRKLSSVQ